MSSLCIERATSKVHLLPVCDEEIDDGEFDFEPLPCLCTCTPCLINGEHCRVSEFCINGGF